MTVPHAARCRSPCAPPRLVLPVTAHAQDAADFYRGKTINLIAGFNPGGGADTYARLVARHLGRHIAGNPTVVVRNMQGAGTVVAANYVFNVSPKDGLELGLFAGNIVIDPLIGGTQHKYDARKFNWIGAPSSDSNVCLSSPKTTFKTDRRRAQARDDHRHVRHLDARFPADDEQRDRHEVQAGEGLCRQRGAAARDGARRDRGLLRRRLQFHAHRGPAGARQGQHPGAGRAVEESRDAECAVHLRLCEVRRGPADLHAGVRLARSRAADRGAAGHAGGPRAGAARRLRQGDEGSGAARRCREGQCRHRADDAAPRSRNSSRMYRGRRRR